MVDYNTSAWRKRRLKFIKEQGENLQCALCDKKAVGPKGGKKYRVHIHHTSYNYPVGEEPDSILKALCPSCHELITLVFKRKSNNDVISSFKAIILLKLNTN